MRKIENDKEKNAEKKRESQNAQKATFAKSRIIS